MKRIVFDTNIIISGKLWSGAPRQAIRITEQRLVQVLISEDMIDELRDVLSRPKFAGRMLNIGKTAETIIDEYLSTVEIVEPEPIPLIVQADPDDDKILACAVGGKASHIVTGDDHLLTLARFRDISIWDVHIFLQKMQKEE